MLTFIVPGQPRGKGRHRVVGTPRQIRARLRALDASPRDDAEADHLDRAERLGAPGDRTHILVRECVQPSLFGVSP